MRPPADDARRVGTLLTLYRASDYDAVLPDGGRVVVRVGAPLPQALAAWVGRAWPAVYLTACNPYSQALAPATNARRLAQLRRELDAAGVAHLCGEGYLPGEAWREPSVLTRGLALADADALARRHAQNAVLVADPDAPVRLRLYRADWRALTPPAPDLEWA